MDGYGSKETWIFPEKSILLRNVGGQRSLRVRSYFSLCKLAIDCIISDSV